MRLTIFILLCFLSACASQHGLRKTEALPSSMSVSAPVTTESSGKSADTAITSVMRVVCTQTDMGGTGFLHKSGRVITAEHVIANCARNDLLLILANGSQIGITDVLSDPFLDLAVITPAQKISAPALPISDITQMAVGEQVTTWGFPAGYNSLIPLLTVGYLAGVDRVKTSTGLSKPRWVVNAAFNGGNSGGPVLSVATGSVIGVVSSKLAPIPPLIESALTALSEQRSGFVYTKTTGEGKQENVSEGQVVSEVLKYLRSQTHLV